jgi:glycosyltransferase involved in cell wall biosynthesis
MKKPLLSVVIPVKLNTGTLEYTVKTVLNQTYSNIQIVISNNSDQDYVRNLISKFNDKRIKIITPKKTNINFRADWEFALNGADGDYVTFLGDDDGVLPNAYSLGMSYILNHDVNAFTWKKINYNWPDHLVEESRNLLIGDSKPEVQKINAKKALRQLAKFRIGYNTLPCIYNSIVSMDDIRSVIDQSKQKVFFYGPIPDVYSGIALSTVVGQYYFASFPLTINGASVKSSGVIQGEPSLEKSQKDKIIDIINAKSSYHEDIGEFSSSIVSIIMGEYMLARKNIDDFPGPKPSWYVYVKRLLRESKTSKNSKDIIKSARYTAKKRGFIMLFLFYKIDLNLASKVSTCFFNGKINLPPKTINNIEDVSLLLTGLIPDIQDVKIINWKSIVSQWLHDSRKIIIDLYRIIKL